MQISDAEFSRLLEDVFTQRSERAPEPALSALALREQARRRQRMAYASVGAVAAGATAVALAAVPGLGAGREPAPGAASCVGPTVAPGVPAPPAGPGPVAESALLRSTDLSGYRHDDAWVTANGGSYTEQWLPEAQLGHRVAAFTGRESTVSQAVIAYAAGAGRAAVDQALAFWRCRPFGVETEFADRSDDEDVIALSNVDDDAVYRHELIVRRGELVAMVLVFRPREQFAPLSRATLRRMADAVGARLEGRSVPAPVEVDAPAEEPPAGFLEPDDVGASWRLSTAGLGPDRGVGWDSAELAVPAGDDCASSAPLATDGPARAVAYLPPNDGKGSAQLLEIVQPLRAGTGEPWLEAMRASACLSRGGSVVVGGAGDESVVLQHRGGATAYVRVDDTAVKLDLTSFGWAPTAPGGTLQWMQDVAARAAARIRDRR
ncbi:hypothetical protein [Motilibacter deserti]|uniref:Uncharacterized protein n=1 Tax=Motilibacter deserti TaxID=2714956 RepID=A0ABX0GRP4_9ACTN|nr:hypothetical protein [Motilibacter deserti]NHC12359.1 hypothetical protein [Motilibacter deserti]